MPIIVKQVKSLPKLLQNLARISLKIKLGEKNFFLNGKVRLVINRKILK